MCFCRMLWRHAHVFPEINQPQRDDAHQRNRCTEAFRTFKLEPFRADTTLEGFMKLFSVPLRRPLYTQVIRRLLR